MTQLLDRAIHKVKSLPNDRQDEAGEMLLAMVEQDSSALKLSLVQQQEIRRRLAGPQTFVAEAEMDEFFRKLAG